MGIYLTPKKRTGELSPNERITGWYCYNIKNWELLKTVIYYFDDIYHNSIENDGYIPKSIWKTEVRDKK